VRLADEIVDTFHNHDKAELLDHFEASTKDAISRQLSLNPILHAFQSVVHEYQICTEHIDAFIESMRMDLKDRTYDSALYEKYIYGSAEVVGLMCLKVFCKGNNQQYQALEAPAKRLGAAFQKINFLRDFKSDFEERGRVYFPSVNFQDFSVKDKAVIEEDIRADFDAGLLGIKQLPKGAKSGVFLAYKYFRKLFEKIEAHSPNSIKDQRIRIASSKKAMLWFQCYLQLRFSNLS
jgi:phytoene/squalene synthetase